MANYYHGLIFRNDSERESYIEVVRKKMEDIKIGVPELADRIGYNRKSVYQFFSDPKIANKFMAAAIADALGLKKSDWN